MHMLTHRTVRILLHNEIKKSFLINIGHRRVGPDNWFLHLGTFVFGEQGRSDLQAGDAVGIREGEAEFLGVVTQFFDGIKLQTEESLISAGESGLGRSGDGGCDGWFRDGAGITSFFPIVSDPRSNSAADEEEDDLVGGVAACRSVAASLLEDRKKSAGRN